MVATTRSTRWRDVLRRTWSYTVVVIGVLVCGYSVSKLSTAAYELRVYGAPYGFVDLQRARTPGTALEILESWARPAGLFARARDYAVWDFALLVGAALILTGLALAFRAPLRRARATPGPGWWSARFGILFDDVLALTIPAMVVAVVLGGAATLIHWQALWRAQDFGPSAAAGAATAVAGVLAYAKFLLVGFAIVVVTGSMLYLLSRNRSRRVKEFLVIVRVCRFSVITVVAVGLGLSMPDQLLDAFRLLAESHGWELMRVLFTEVFVAVWAATVWYTARFLLNVNFQTDPDFYPGSPEFPGERQLPALLGGAAFVVFGVGALKAWYQTSDSTETRYWSLLALAIVNGVLGAVFWRGVTRWEQRVARPLAPPRGETFEAMPKSVKNFVFLFTTAALLLWLLVFFGLQTFAPYLGTVILLLGAAITVTLAGSLLVWHGERAQLPALSIIVAVALVFSLFNDNHIVRRLGDAPALRKEDRIEITDRVREWHARVRARYPGVEHPMFLVSAAGGGIRAAYWTAAVLARLQDLNPSFAEHTLLVSSVSGGSLGALVFANLVDTTAGGAPVDVADCQTKGRYRALAASLLSHDFLAPVAGSMLYGDFLARLLPFSFLSDRAEALEVAWERAWDAVKQAAPVAGPLWEGNPFARSFDALHSKARSGQLPLFLLNGTIVESGSRILVSHLRHPQEFRGDLEHAFDHRRAAMRMSTAALMSARFTYVSPAGTYAPGTHVVDGGYFENSGVVTALQWWHELDEVIAELDRDHPRDTIRDVFIYIDNNPPPSRRDLAAAHRSVAPDRADSLNTVSGLLPEMSPPVDALLHARGAHAVEARQRAERIFGANDFIPFDTNRIDEGTRRRLDNAPLGWALSRTTQRLLDDALCTNQDHVKRVMSALPPRQP